MCAVKSSFNLSDVLKTNKQTKIRCSWSAGSLQFYCHLYGTDCDPAGGKKALTGHVRNSGEEGIRESEHMTCKKGETEHGGNSFQSLL